MMPPSVFAAMVAVEAGGDLLVERRVRQQVAGELLDRELVERHVAVEGVDHPVAPAPHRPVAVALVAVGVGVAGARRASGRHALAVARRGEQAIDHLLVGVRRLVREEGIDLRGRRRQAGQVERDAADQRRPVGLGRRRQPFLFEAGQDEGVDADCGPSRGPSRRAAAAGRGSKAQCLPHVAALVDPALAASRSAAAPSLRFDFGGGITLVRPSALMRRISSLSALFRGSTTRRILLGVEPQLRLAAFSSGPWHWKQLSARIGSTSRLKRTVGAGRRRGRAAERARARPGDAPRGSASFTGESSPRDATTGSGGEGKPPSTDRSGSRGQSAKGNRPTSRSAPPRVAVRRCSWRTEADGERHARNWRRAVSARSSSWCSRGRAPS